MGPEPFVSHRAWDADRKVRFLHHLSDKGDVRAACAIVGMSRTSAYLLRRRDGAFAQGWQAALVLARQHVEDVLATRALDGVEEAVWFRGELVGMRKRYDARLLLAHLGRLDRLAGADGEAALHMAQRFDEVLALVAGEAAGADLSEDEAFDDGGEALREAALAREGQEGPLDPLPLPPVRAAYALAEAEPAYIAAREDWLDETDALDREYEELHGWQAAEEGPKDADGPDYPPPPDFAPFHAASAARWDRWQARAFDRVDGAIGPVEFKSLGGLGEWGLGGGPEGFPLDRVNRVNLGPISREATACAGGSARARRSRGSPCRLRPARRWW